MHFRRGGKDEEKDLVVKCGKNYNKERSFGLAPLPRKFYVSLTRVTATTNSSQN